MRLGVFTVLLADRPLEVALDALAELGVEAVELGTGSFPGSAHCDPDVLLADPARATALRRAVDDRGMVISALSQHGNPVHPNIDVARAAHETWLKTARLAELLEVPVVCGFSGCPGDGPNARAPNWVTCPWPDDFRAVLEWQWSEVLVPYWADQAEVARRHGVTIALEPHPGFCVYNPETLLRLRAAVGPEIAANWDPSHLFWQGMDAVETILLLGRAGAIAHVHAKDTYLDAANIRRHGVLDTKAYDRIADRSWVFRTIGYGQGERTWRDIISALRTVDYDYVLSIEHEDGLLSTREGLEKAIALLRGIVVREPAGETFWERATTGRGAE